MYRRPKFLEVLLAIRREMATEADYDVDLFAELTRSGARPSVLNSRAPDALDTDAVDQVTELTQSREY